MFGKKESYESFKYSYESMLFSVKQVIHYIIKEEMVDFDYDEYLHTFSTEKASVAEIEKACNNIRYEIEMLLLKFGGKSLVRVRYLKKIGEVHVDIAFLIEQLRIDLKDTYRK